MAESEFVLGNIGIIFRYEEFGVLLILEIIDIGSRGDIYR